MHMSKKVCLTKREQRVEDWFEPIMLTVTLLLVLTLAIPFIFSLPTTWVKVFAILNLLIWCTFYIELFVKVFVAKSKVGALKRNWALIIITIAPLFIPFRLMRLSRLLPFVRFIRLQNTIGHLKRSVRELIYNVEYILITFVIFILVSAFVMWQVEVNFDGSITSLADALWWSVMTVTTIGYGDVVPQSQEGKVVGGVVSLIGTILFIIFVVRITTMFVYDKEMVALKKELRAKKN
ncbi:MAG: voltage-gated potassium channel [Candidatus Paceibacteria bacterium]|jgi:voltage-gated potassium channel